MLEKRTCDICGNHYPLAWDRKMTVYLCDHEYNEQIMSCCPKCSRFLLDTISSLKHYKENNV